MIKFNKKILTILCTIAFIMPLCLIGSYVFADETEVEEKSTSITEKQANETLQKIIKGAELYKHLGVADDDAVVWGEYALELNSGKKVNCYNPDNGTVVIDGNEFYLNVYYQGNKISDGNYVLQYDNKGNYARYLDLSGISGYDTADAWKAFETDNKITYELVNVNNAEEKFTLDSEMTVKMKKDQIKAEVVEETENVSLFSAWWNSRPLLVLVGLGNLDKTAQSIVETLAILITPAGDAFLHMVNLAVGEPITMDKIVYDDVNRTDINFFEKAPLQESGDGKEKVSTPLKSLLDDTVNKWYGFFRNLALICYMVLLVYMGIRIILNSTAERKASYKIVITAWATGVAMLFLFPYVMKLTIQLNHTICTFFKAELGGDSSEVAPLESTSTSLIDLSLKKARKYYGNEKFVMLVLGYDVSEDSVTQFRSNALFGTGDAYFKNNEMMKIRYIGRLQQSLPLIIIYVIMIGELIALVIMYYRRVFTLAFLIAIFPIVCVVYLLSKIGDIRMNSFGIWFKEFLVNVFVQSFHAATYTVIVNIGVNAYLDSENWLFMIICVAFLFDGEKIIRGLFNAKSSTGSIGDLAASGALAWGVAKSLPSLLPSKKDKDDKAEKEDPDEKADKDKKKPKAPSKGGSPDNMIDNEDGKTGHAPKDSLENATNKGENTAGSAKDMNGVGGSGYSKKNPFDSIKSDVNGQDDDFYNKIGKKTMNLGKRGLTFAGKTAGGSMGALIGTTYGLAMRNSKSGLEPAVGYGISAMQMGKDLGGATAGLIGSVPEKIASRHRGNTTANRINSGQMDSELGIEEALDNSKELEAENAQIEVDYAGDAAEIARRKAAARALKAKAIREAYAKVARQYGKGDTTGAEIEAIKEFLDEHSG